jgi:hypothetical protein
MSVRLENVCHTEFLRFEGRSVTCHKCARILYREINDFLGNLKPHFSLFFAQLYANQTGNLNVKCKIPIENVPDVLPFRDVFIKYETLVQTVRLLGIMNRPFVTYANTEAFDRNGTLNVKIVQKFLDKFQKLIDRESEIEDDEQMSERDKRHIINTLKVVHTYIGRKAEGTNAIDQFCEVYAPYAWSFDPAPAERKHLEDPESMASVLKQINRDTTAIRARYSPYSLHFEIVYVMVYVLMLSDDVDAIASVVLGLVARACKNFFRWPMHEECRKILANKLKKNVRNSTVLQNRVKLLQTGRCRDYVSLELMRDVKTLHDVFDKEFEAFWCSTHEPGLLRSEKIVLYAETQVFPSLLFADDAQYYGFVLVMPFLLKHYDRKNDVLQKNVTSRAKTLIDVVEHFVYRMKGFENPDYWTLDVFKLFMGSDDKLKDSIQDVFRCFMMEEL